MNSSTLRVLFLLAARALASVEAGGAPCRSYAWI